MSPFVRSDSTAPQPKVPERQVSQSGGYGPPVAEHPRERFRSERGDERLHSAQPVHGRLRQFAHLFVSLDSVAAVALAACPSPKPRPTRSEAARSVQSVHWPKPRACLGDWATGILRPSAFARSHRILREENGERTGRAGAVAPTWVAVRTGPETGDYAALRM
jgi:hypothetical protein